MRKYLVLSRICEFSAYIILGTAVQDYRLALIVILMTLTWYLEQKADEEQLSVSKKKRDR